MICLILNPSNSEIIYPSGIPKFLFSEIDIQETNLSLSGGKYLCSSRDFIIAQIAVKIFQQRFCILYTSPKIWLTLCIIFYSDLERAKDENLTIANMLKTLLKSSLEKTSL